VWTVNYRLSLVIVLNKLQLCHLSRRFCLPMSSASLDTLRILDPQLSNGYILFTLIWFQLATIPNVLVVIYALSGKLINRMITKTTILTSTFATMWMIVYTIDCFVASHRWISVALNWFGYPVTLAAPLQHIELLKLFSSLSDYWNPERCKRFQIVMVVLHVIICSINYALYLGLENNNQIRSVAFY
jgi:hypothetical protein